jgi:hypothetical protein
LRGGERLAGNCGDRDGGTGDDHGGNPEQDHPAAAWLFVAPSLVSYHKTIK